jgi:cysteine desulfurase/selenocysteine lyase
MNIPEAFDAELIARIANELFTAAPTSPAGPGGAPPSFPAPPRGLPVVGPWNSPSATVATDPSAIAPTFAAAAPTIADVPSWLVDSIASLEPVYGTALRGDAPSLPSSTFYFLEPYATEPALPRIDAFELPATSAPNTRLSALGFDAGSVRRDFPILNERVNGKPLVWLDNAATTQKPEAVIQRLAYFYAHENSNIHRAAHTLAARATDAYEAAREKVRGFLNASTTSEIIFVRGATEGINLVAQSWGRKSLEPGDEVVLTTLEHHSNIVPWQLVCAEKGARLRVAPVGEDGQVLLDAYERLLGPRTKLVALTHVSNALGTVLPVQQMTAAAHRAGARVLVDGAQAISHMRVDVQAIGCDFYVFSGHKVFAPTGIGAVYGRSDVLDTLPPWQGGGNMITDVTFERTLYAQPPMRFEAGTGNIADAVGLGAAIDYLENLGLENVARHEHDLLVYGTEALQTIPGLRLIGTAAEKVGVMSFVIDGFRVEDIGQALAADGIAVRAGHHCAQPALRRFGLESTVRPSLALYNTCEDVDALIASLRRLTAQRR